MLYAGVVLGESIDTMLGYVTVWQDSRDSWHKLTFKITPFKTVGRICVSMR
jgi:hypothetical protein